MDKIPVKKSLASKGISCELRNPTSVRETRMKLSPTPDLHRKAELPLQIDAIHQMGEWDANEIKFSLGKQESDHTI